MFKEICEIPEIRDFFSANVRRDKQLKVSGILGVHNDLRNNNYLDLHPSLGGLKRGFLAS